MTVIRSDADTITVGQLRHPIAIANSNAGVLSERGEYVKVMYVQWPIEGCPHSAYGERPWATPST